MIIASLMVILIWFVLSLLRIVVDSDRSAIEDVDLGLFAYVDSSANADIVKPKRLRNRA